MNPLKRPLDRRAYLNNNQLSSEPKDGRPKQSSLLRDGVILTEQFLWQGEWFPLKHLAEGTIHTLWEFTGSSSIRFDKTALQVSEIAVRTFRPDASVRDVAELMRKDLENYNALVQAGIAVATVYFANSRCLVVEKMHERVNIEGWKDVKSIVELSEKDQRILSFVRDVLQKNALAGQNIVSDFCPRNVMLDRAGTPKIVDYSGPRFGETKSYVKKWSLGNQVIADYLTPDEAIRPQPAM